MSDTRPSILFLCTGNSARSILAEAIARRVYGAALRARSAGSTPKGAPHPLALETLERSIDLLLSSERPRLQLQFFGGEALLEYARVQHAIAYGSAQAEARGKALSFILSSNGWSLDADKLSWLAQFPVKLALSLDGDPRTQNRFRHSRHKHEDSYATGIAPRASAWADP